MTIFERWVAVGSPAISGLRYCHCARGIEAFLKKTDIAYRQKLTFLFGSRPYAIAVFFKNASALRVFGYRMRLLRNGSELMYFHCMGVFMRRASPMEDPNRKLLVCTGMVWSNLE